MGKQTPLFAAHVAAGAKMVDFGGWDMPIHYGSQIEEHHAIRREAGVCDVSHMTVIDVTGPGSQDFLRQLLPNDVLRLQAPGKALYSAMLNAEGGILDDLIVYLVAENSYRVVVNCATRDKDLAWMNQQIAGFAAELKERPDLAILAVQGPEAIERFKTICSAQQVALIDELKPFVGKFCDDWFIARTGYTGEKGLEVIFPGDRAAQLWEQVLSAGIHPVGLGARDTLRLEAGMNLYGSDMDESVTPYEANMANTVVMDDHDFIGKSALEQQLTDGVSRELIGLVMLEKGVLRAHYPVFAGDVEIGEITSGAFSPTLSHSIAFARVKTGYEGQALTVGIRNKQVPVHRVAPSFARAGKQVYKLDSNN
ncbi:MAG: glycine cleavage system aminomethyltransferase GcvT [Pseudomonadales bacterium]